MREAIGCFLGHVDYLTPVRRRPKDWDVMLPARYESSRRASASREFQSHANLKVIMKPIKFKKRPLLYGASFLLDIFGPNLAARRRTLHVESDDGRASITALVRWELVLQK
jgi:hypothetical protein